MQLHGSSWRRVGGRGGSDHGPAEALRGAWSSRRTGTRARFRTTLALGVALSVIAGVIGTADAAVTTGKKRHSRSEEAKKGPARQPKGPLLIVVSIGEQRVSLFGDGALVARGPTSTGMRGHPTPEGVFSVIQKDRYHRSNIYSDAPMPYMQRITWSGVALHAGVLPGYPASHGCIRLTYEFATMLWRVTQMGVRVIVTRNGVEPVEIAHANLFVPKAKPADPPVASDPPMRASGLAGRLRLAEATDPTTATDAATPSVEVNPSAEVTPPEVTVPPKPLETKAIETKDDADAPPNMTGSVKPAEELGPAELPPSQPVKAGDLPAQEPSATGSTKPADAVKRAEPSPPVAPTVAEPAAASEPFKVAEPPSAEPPQAAEAPKPADPLKLMEAAKAEFSVMPVSGETSRKKDQISVFVSRKEGRLFVRQNFLPLFSVPVTIRNPERSLGTHVFTAMEPTRDGAAMRWTVVTIPGQYGKADAEEPRAKRSRRKGHEEDVKPVVHEPPLTAADALDRIEMPKDVAARVSDLLVPGFSLIVSDHGISGETNDGTDFIVLTR